MTDTTNPKTTQILINNHEVAEKFPKMMEAVFKRCMHFAGCSVNIFPSERDKTGWLEWLLVAESPHGGKLTIGAIERSPGASIEFHS